MSSFQPHDSCQNCPYWGHRGSDWADCYRVINKIAPELFEIEDDNGNLHTIPFDPHDVKYFDQTPEFINIYKKLKKRKMPEGVRVQPVKTKDVRFTEDGAPIIRSVELLFFQTHKDYSCKGD